MQFLNRRRCSGGRGGRRGRGRKESRDAKRARDAPPAPHRRAPLSRATSRPRRSRSVRSFPTQRSYSRRAPAHSLTTPDGSHYGNEPSAAERANATARREPESEPVPPPHPPARRPDRCPRSRQLRAIDPSIDRTAEGAPFFKSRARLPLPCSPPP